MGLSLDEAARKVSVSVQKLERAERGEDHLTLRQAESAGPGVPTTACRAVCGETAQGGSARSAIPPTAGRAWSAVGLRDAHPGAPYPRNDKTLPSSSMTSWMRIRRGRRCRSAIPTTRLSRQRWHELRSAWTWTSRKRGGIEKAMSPLWAWIEAVERLGVLVMQDGSMSVTQMRGFAAVHDSVPAVVVNTKDDPRSRAFTPSSRAGAPAAGTGRTGSHVRDRAVARRVRRQRADAASVLRRRLQARRR